MRLVISSGIRFVYSVAHRSVLFMAPTALGRSISCTLALLSACSMYCSNLITSSVVEIPSLYPYRLLLVSICVIFVSFRVISPGDILHIICVRHIVL